MSPIPQVTIPDDDDDAIIVKDVDADVDVAVDVNMPPSTLPELYLLCNKCSRAIQAAWDVVYVSWLAIIYG